MKHFRSSTLSPDRISLFFDNVGGHFNVSWLKKSSIFLPCIFVDTYISEKRQTWSLRSSFSASNFDWVFMLDILSNGHLFFLIRASIGKMCSNLFKLFSKITNVFLKLCLKGLRVSVLLKILAMFIIFKESLWFEFYCYHYYPWGTYEPSIEFILVYNETNNSAITFYVFVELLMSLVYCHWWKYILYIWNYEISIS